MSKLKPRETNQDAFRNGYFHKDGKNIYDYGMPLWECWEIGKHFNIKGLGYFNLRRGLENNTYVLEDHRQVRMEYVRKRTGHSFFVMVIERERVRGIEWPETFGLRDEEEYTYEDQDARRMVGKA